MPKNTRKTPSRTTPQPTDKPRPKRRTTPPKPRRKHGPVHESPGDPHRLATVFLRLRSLGSKWALKFWRGQFWKWSGRRYERVEDIELRGEVTTVVKQEFDRVADARQAAKGKDGDKEKSFVRYVTRSVVSDVVQALRGKTLIPGNVEQPSWIPQYYDPKKGRHAHYIAMENGLLDMDALVRGAKVRLLRHTPDWFSPVCLPYASDPKARCPKWTAFISHAMENDQGRINLLQEWFGYSITHDTAFQKFLVIYGDGGTGKTVTLDVLTTMLGGDNVSHVPVELFDKRFQLTPTIGMLANIATEVGEISRGAEAVLKAFTSGDRMYFDRKGLPGVHALPSARLAFAANNLPRFADRSSGIWRRMLLVPYRVVVPPTQQDPHLLEKLLRELPGIFSWAIEGLRRLRAHGQFTEPALCLEALEAYRTESNPARAFLQEWAYFAVTKRTACETVYDRYRMWCQEHGYLVLDASQFGKEVGRSFPKVARKRGATTRSRTRPWHYIGLALKDPASPPSARPVAATSRRPRRSPSKSGRASQVS